MKITCFCANDLETLERTVNAFLDEQHLDIMTTRISYAAVCYGEGSDYIQYSVVISYSW